MNAAQRGLSKPPSSFDFFATPLREAVGMLRAGLARGDPLLLLTGQAGTGKTTVVRRLFEELDPHRYTLGGVFGSYAEGDPLLNLVVQHLGPRTQMPVDAFLTLELFLRRWNNAGRDAVLLIEEAHSLNAEALQQLWQLAAPTAVGRPRLHVLLVAEKLPDAVAELTRASRTLPIGTRCHLRALQAAETREFVLHRIGSGGGTGPPTFGNEALDAIHERTGGVLRRIHLLCDRILWFLAMEGRREISARLVAEVDSQLRGELCVPGLSNPDSSPIVVRGPTTATCSTQLEPASATAQSAPNAAERAPAPTANAAHRATSWRRLGAASRHKRAPSRLLAGSLVLSLFAILGLGMPAFFRATVPASPGDLPAEESRGQVSDPSMARGQGPARTVAFPPASPVALTAAALPTEFGSPLQPATAHPGIAPATAQASIPAAALCSSPADSLGLCAAATQAQARFEARAEVADAAPAAPRTDPAPCSPERAALGLCDAP